MSNYDDIKLLIKHTTGQENILGVNKVYMKYMGSLEGGVLLSQLIYYSDKSSRKDGYFWKSYKEWYDETFISEHNIKKIVSKMKELGFLETKLIKANAAPTIHYRVDMDKFTELFIPFLKILRIDSENIKNGNLKYSESITKSTTENTNKDKDIKDISQQSNLPTKQVSKYDESSPYYGMAKYLYEKMLTNNPKAKEPNYQVWADDFRKIIEIDERDALDVKSIIDFSQNDSFWCSNILSPAKLRKQYDQLSIKMNQRSNNKNNIQYQKQDAMSLMLDKFENGGFENEQRKDEPGIDRILIP